MFEADEQLAALAQSVVLDVAADTRWPCSWQDVVMLIAVGASVLDAWLIAVHRNVPHSLSVPVGCD